MEEDDFDDQWCDGGDDDDDFVGDECNYDYGFAFLSLTEEAKMAAWHAVEAEWNEVLRSYAPRGHTFVEDFPRLALLRAIYFSANLFRRHSG